MNEKDFITKKLEETEKRIKELLEDGSLKKINSSERSIVAAFFDRKSLNRFQTTQIIFRESSTSTDYCDYSEAVGSGYYSMYYIVHAYIAKKYGLKLREGVRGVHAITLHLIIYYLIKTNKLSRHLYEEYCAAMNLTAEIQAFNPDEFQKDAFSYAQKYEKERGKREMFTYFIAKNAEKSHAESTLQVAEKFIAAIREIMSQ